MGDNKSEATTRFMDVWDKSALKKWLADCKANQGGISADIEGMPVVSEPEAETLVSVQSAASTILGHADHDTFFVENRKGADFLKNLEWEGPLGTSRSNSQFLRPAQLR
jgi:hypothetical protein